MKKILLCIAATILFADSHAQIRGSWGKRGSVHFFTNLTADYHINNWDVKKDADAPKDAMVSANKIGTRIGFDMERITRHRILIAIGFDFRFEPQQLSLKYDARQMGFTNSNHVYTEEKTFTNRNMELHGAIGYSVAMGNNALDIAIGVRLSMPVNGRADSAYTSFRDMGNGYKEPVYSIKSGWGTQRAEVKAQGDDPNMLAGFQFTTAYRLLQPAIFNDRAVRIGFNACFVPGARYANRAELITYGANRDNVYKYSYNDLHLSAALFLGVEL